MAPTDQRIPRNGSSLPGAGLDAVRMPGHWLPARLGKRVLRPGGAELTRWMPDAPGVDPQDRVVEPAAGLGALLTGAGAALAGTANTWGTDTRRP
ncbi:hypothetical protein AB5J52_37995 [Streptomyces sp. R39]|uniref:SAM-dependent methyltransferase n=1 Tax=Streptomyces sp. R39 TaxID=3238631 RepID=A0AB39QYI6_9ACTN